MTVDTRTILRWGVAAVVLGAAALGHPATIVERSVELELEGPTMVERLHLVVALEEVETWDENQPEKYRSLLEEFTGDTWRLQWAPVNGKTSTEGNVILTRLPVISSTYHQMHATSDWDALYVNRSVAQATISVGGVSVNVFATHVDYYSTSARTVQVADLMNWVAGFAGPRIIGGDFNSWWGESWITTIRSSALRCTSSSRISASTPGAVAAKNAGSVFSGASAAPPRSATTLTWSGIHRTNGGASRGGPQAASATPRAAAPSGGSVRLMAAGTP